MRFSMIRTRIMAAMAVPAFWAGAAGAQDYNFTPTIYSYTYDSAGIWVNDSGTPLSSPPPATAVLRTNFGSTDSTGALLEIYNSTRNSASVDLGALQIGSLGANVSLGTGSTGMSLVLGGSSVTAGSFIAAGRSLTMNYGTQLGGRAVSGGGAPTLSNAGTILMAGGGNNISGFSLTNTGIINAAGGGGFFSEGGPPTVVTNTGGTIMVGNGQQFTIYDSTVNGGTLQAGSNGTGTGKFYIGGLPSGNSSNTTLSNLTLQASATIAGPSGAVVNFENVHYISPGTQLYVLQLSGATLNLSGVNTFDLGVYNRMEMFNDPTNSGGIVLQAGSTFNLNGQLLSGIASSAPGMISGSGTIANSAGSTALIYNTYGTIAATTGDIMLNHVAVSGGILTETGGHAFQIIGGASLNDVTVTSGTVVNVQSSGSLSVDGGGMTLNGTLNNAAGTYGNTFGLGLTGSITGTGSLTNSGNIAVQGSINLASVQNSGGMTFIGNTSLSGSVDNTNGVMTVSSGNLGAHGLLTIANGLNGGALAAVSGDVQFAGGTVSNAILQAYPANNSILEVTANTTFTNDQFLFGSSLKVDNGVQATFTGTTALDGSYTGNMHLTGGSTLTGNGSIAGTLTLDGGTILSPGHSPGNLTAGAEVWNGGAAFHFVINDAAGTDGGLGQNWNGTTIAGALTINATSANPFTIDIASLEKSDNMPGALSHFDSSQSYQWLFVQAGSITGFDPSDFIFTDTNFTDFVSVTQDFSIERVGNDLVIDYGTPAAVPEPATLTTAVIGAACLALVAACRRRRQASA